MPVMDGITCVKQIRRWEREGMIKGHVPIIAVTANARKGALSFFIYISHTLLLHHLIISISSQSSTLSLISNLESSSIEARVNKC